MSGGMSQYHLEKAVAEADKRDQQAKEKAEMEKLIKAQVEMHFQEMYNSFLTMAYDKILAEMIHERPWNKIPSEKDPRSATEYTGQHAARAARIAHIYATEMIYFQKILQKEAEEASNGLAVEKPEGSDPMAEGGTQPAVADVDYKLPADDAEVAADGR